MEFLSEINVSGLIIGLSTFLIIGIFHPLVIKGEYHFGERIKWVFLIAGILFLAGALLVTSTIASALLGVTAFSCFWSIHEVSQQVERVRKGWFPANPKRAKNKKADNVASKS